MEEQTSLQAIQDIRKMMDRSSRFISLSGLSGISAGICALIGAAVAYPHIQGLKPFFINESEAATQLIEGKWQVLFNVYIVWIGAATFIAALISAFVFTRIKTKKDGIGIWSTASRRLMLSVCVPLIAGGIFLLRLIYFYGTAGLIAPGCLIFYGLALVNASRYTLSEIKYLGYCQLLLGIINLWCIGYGIYFWAFGFGVMHIVYGIYMWNRHEKNKSDQ